MPLMPAALSGLRVLDLTSGPVGGFATVVLADFGADVIKIERPGGDPFRSLAAAPLWLRGKRSATLDLTTDAGRACLHERVLGADVVLVSGRPGRAERLGADAGTLCGLNPGLVHCSISGFGPRGAYASYPAYDGVVAAKVGRMNVFTGQLPRSGPSFAAVPVASHTAAQGAAQGVLAALIARETSGRGARVETSLLQALLPYDLAELLLVQLAEQRGERPPGPETMGGGMPTLNYHPIMASDGRWIQLGNLLEHLFYAFLDATDLLPEMIGEERFQGSPAVWTPETIEEARDRILLRVRERPADEWMERFRQNGNVAAEPWLTAQEALDHPELVANGDVIEHVHPDLGVVRQIGPIAELRETPAAPGGPMHAPGEDTDPVLDETPEPRAHASGSAAPRGRPLEGVTVLEVATIIAAPLGTSMLADLGARVIKVEALDGDPYRHLLPGGLLAVKTNAGKQSICIDLKSERGREIVQKLVARADALVHNFRPGVPERLGFDYETARAIRPDLVWVSANGYGPHCPAARRPSAHPVPGATMGGATFQAGVGMPPTDCADVAELREGARRLMRANEPNPDPNTSVIIATATLLGLLARARHGVGQDLYVNMLVANAWANGDDFLSYAGKPDRPEVDADLLGLGATYRLYPVRESWVFLALVTDGEWSRFCSAAAPALARDARFATREVRRQHDDALATELSQILAGRTADDWEKLLTAVDVGCVRADASGPGAFFAGDDHARENGLTAECHHARFGDMKRWGPIVTCDGGPSDLGPGALAGEHTDALLTELGYSAADITRLRTDRIVASEKP
jgi:crotonobetainyl-CoA:carnitine CoA-transferase CaiB-like acyl-CoA transferase